MTDHRELDQEVEPEAGVRDGRGLDMLVAYLKENRGFDFADYKRAGLERRLLKRTRTLELASFQDYVDYLEVHPDEVNTLFDSVLINATSFFRDPTAWETVAQHVVPRILEAKRGGESIRVWSAGCATGQEAYSIAMLFAEALGLDAFTRTVKIYATDLDEDALAQARVASYTSRELAAVPPQLVAKYFEQSGATYTFIAEARRRVIFGRHNLAGDAPISRIDLLLCRNTLLYFNTEAQDRILSSIHFALAEAGVLFLGKAEMLPANSTLFAPIDIERRLFAKVTPTDLRGRIAPTHAVSNVEAPRDQPQSQPDDETMLDAAFEASPIAQIGLSVRSTITVMNEQARKLFGTAPSDVGRPLQDTAVASRLESVLELVERAAAEKVTACAPLCEVRGGSDVASWVDVTASPLVDVLGTARGIHLTFLDVTGSWRLLQELKQATRELGDTTEQLHAKSEQLDTTNEELQSTVEELETTNEELQSTNEELQSTNEELQWMNEMLRSRVSDAAPVNLHLDSHVVSVRSPGEEGYQEVVLPGTDRNGEAIQCLVKIKRLTQNNAPRGIILLMEELEQPPAGSSENAHGTTSGK